MNKIPTKYLDVAKFEGSQAPLNFVDSMIVGCLNYNASSLASVIKNVEELEKQIEELKGVEYDGESLPKNPTNDNMNTDYSRFMKVIDEIKAEINYVGAHSDYGIQSCFAIAIAIIDKHVSRIVKEEEVQNGETTESV